MRAREAEGPTLRLTEHPEAAGRYRVRRDLRVSWNVPGSDFPRRSGRLARRSGRFPRRAERLGEALGVFPSRGAFAAERRRALCTDKTPALRYDREPLAVLILSGLCEPLPYRGHPRP